MSESLLLIPAIPLAAVVLVLAAAFALSDSRPPATRSDAAPLVRVRLLCPLSNELTGADIGVDHPRQRVAVVRCERFPDGPVRCDRACFPELPIAGAGGVQAHAA